VTTQNATTAETEKAPGGENRAVRTMKEYHEEVLRSGIQDGALLKDVWPFLRPHKAWLIAALATTVLTTGLSLSRPLIMLAAIDESLATGDRMIMFWGGALFAGVTVLEQFLNFIQVYSTQIVGARAMADLRLSVFRFLGQLPLRFFDRQPVGRIVTRVTNDVDAILELFGSGVLNAFGDLLSLIGVVVIMMTLDWKLSLIGFAALPFIFVLIVWVRKRAREAFRTIRGETARMNANMNEQVNGVALVQAYGRQDAMLREFDTINSSYRDANIRSVKYDAIQDAAIDALSAVSLASIVMALGYESASYGTVVALTFYLKQFFEPISMLAQRYTLLQAALSGAERVFGLLRIKDRDAPVSPASEGDHGDPGFAVELSHVTFGYTPGLDVLHDVSLRARPGESIALVGPTGSGKTTITALLLRLYDHHQGAVRVNGRDAKTMTREELRRKFAVVPQDAFLFPGTLAENVATGEVPDMDRVRQVLEEMDILEFLTRRVGGLDAPISGGGANFSAGERQLIAFARALYRDAKILILDEATASVDSDTEARMQRALTKLMEGRTSVVVAHRLSTIAAADRIVVLQEQRAVQRSRDDDLVARSAHRQRKRLVPVRAAPDRDPSPVRAPQAREPPFGRGDETRLLAHAVDPAVERQVVAHQRPDEALPPLVPGSREGRHVGGARREPCGEERGVLAQTQRIGGVVHAPDPNIPPDASPRSRRAGSRPPSLAGARAMSSRSACGDSGRPRNSSITCFEGFSSP
jgi:ATP-binding cassette subfamily B protein